MRGGGIDAGRGGVGWEGFLVVIQYKGQSNKREGILYITSLTEHSESKGVKQL